MKKYTVNLEEDANGDLVLPFPQDLLEEVGWKEGDILNWKDNEDGTFSLTKKSDDETEWVLVECISQFRNRYMVQVPKGKIEHALDTVTMDEAKEFSQKYIGETIISHRVLTQDEALSLFDEDNDYISSWDDEKKISMGFTKIGETIEK